jgi:hypothetical protein
MVAPGTVGQDDTDSDTADLHDLWTAVTWTVPPSARRNPDEVC